MKIEMTIYENVVLPQSYIAHTVYRCGTETLTIEVVANRATVIYMSSTIDICSHVSYNEGVNLSDLPFHFELCIYNQKLCCTYSC